MNHPRLDKAIFIIVPRLGTAGPEKGAIALASLLGSHYSVFLLTFKSTSNFSSSSYIHVDLFSKADLDNSSKLAIYSALKQEILHLSSNFSSNVLISFCLSADFYALCLRRYFSITISSVRGHLIRNYASDFGLLGYLIGVFHLFILSFFDKRIIMDPTMNKQLFFTNKQSNHVIPNLVRQDIPQSLGLSFESSSEIRILFIGSLSPRKDPYSLITLARSLLQLNKNFKILVLGDGPLLIPLIDTIERYSLTNYFDIRGYVKDPYPLINSATLLFHPSFSEGTSRSCLEALQLGVPCLVRDTAPNRFFVSEGYNGYLFSDPSTFPSMVLNCLALKLRNNGKSLLLPKYYQAAILSKYINLFGLIDE